MFSVSR